MRVTLRSTKAAFRPCGADGVVGTPGSAGFADSMLPMTSPEKELPGGGKFEAAKEWPAIPDGVLWIQLRPTLVGAAGPRNDIEVRLEHAANDWFPMAVTPVPMVTEAIALHPSKAMSPMAVTLLGMLMELRTQHIENELLPMYSVPLGMITDGNAMHAEKA